MQKYFLFIYFVVGAHIPNSIHKVFFPISLPEIGNFSMHFQDRIFGLNRFGYINIENQETLFLTRTNILLFIIIVFWDF